MIFFCFQNFSLAFSFQQFHYDKPMVFLSSHVWVWELDHKEGWTLKNLCFWTVVMEKILESLRQQGNQPWIFIGRIDTTAETPILWPPDIKADSLGRPWCWGRLRAGTRAAEDEIIGWHHWLNEQVFEQTPGDSGGQRSLECCSPWGLKESETT